MFLRLYGILGNFYNTCASFSRLFRTRQTILPKADLVVRLADQLTDRCWFKHYPLSMLAVALRTWNLVIPFRSGVPMKGHVFGSLGDQGDHRTRDVPSWTLQSSGRNRQEKNSTMNM